MFLKLTHTNWEVYQLTLNLVTECKQISKTFPKEEQFVLSQQINRAALLVHLNLAEGAARKSSKERIRFYEIARSSVVEIDSALEIGARLNYFTPEKAGQLGELVVQSFVHLTRLINSNSKS